MSAPSHGEPDPAANALELDVAALVSGGLKGVVGR